MELKEPVPLKQGYGGVGQFTCYNGSQGILEGNQTTLGVRFDFMMIVEVLRCMAPCSIYIVSTITRYGGVPYSPPKAVP